MVEQKQPARTRVTRPPTNPVSRHRKLIDQKTRGASARLRRRKPARQVDQEGGEEIEKRLSGWPFYLVLSLAILNDTTDIFLNLTGVGGFLSFLTGVLFVLTITLYYYINGVTLTTRKMVMWLITGITIVVPFLNFLPTSIINLSLTRKFENSDLVQSVASKTSVRRNIKRRVRRSLSNTE